MLDKQITNKILKGVMLIPIIVITLYILHLLSRVFIADNFVIPTSSMEPTLKAGDKVVVNKLLFGARIYTDFNFTKDNYQLQAFRTKGLRDIQRNDILVFNKANHNRKIKFVINKVYCKRCVALPGDTITISAGKTKVNNFEGTLGVKQEVEKLIHTPDSLVSPKCLRAMPKDDHFYWTIRNFGPYYIPRKGDIIPINPQSATLYKVILEWETGKKLSIDWKKNRVMAGNKAITKHQFTNNYYFMMGDNVQDSDDSRYKGPIPESYIIGIVSYIY